MGTNILVIREAFHECPESVVVLVTKTAEQVISDKFPGAAFDGNGGFDTSDGGSYVYDVCIGEAE